MKEGCLLSVFDKFVCCEAGSGLAAAFEKLFPFIFV
jgi:hypothetical protein